MPDLATLALLALIPGTAALTAIVTRRYYTTHDPCTRALQRIITAPDERHLAKAIDDADNLLRDLR